MTAPDFAADPATVTALGERLFRQARTHGHWLPQRVPTALLHEMVALMQLAPTSMNTQPLRLPDAGRTLVGSGLRADVGL